VVKGYQRERVRVYASNLVGADGLPLPRGARPRLDQPVQFAAKINGKGHLTVEGVTGPGGKPIELVKVEPEEDAPPAE
jgi:hypothetical protein